MKTKKIKYIFELIFIFILPILFLIPVFSIEKEFEYDNNGNYQISNSHININLDNIYEYNETIVNGPNDYYFELIGTIYIKTNNANTTIIDGREYILLCETTYLKNTKGGGETLCVAINTANFEMYIAPNRADLYYPNITIQPDEINILINNNYYNKYIILESYYFYYDEGTLTTYNGYYEIEQNEGLTLFGQMKEIIKDNLHIDNTFIDIIIYYNFLWLLMFIIWHLFYLLLDFLLHFWKKEE